MEPAIEITRLTKAYRRHFYSPSLPVLRGLDLLVQQGEVVGFLGPNGAGKSTTIKAIVGLIRPSAGTVRVFGRDPWTPDAKRRIGFLPESPYFYDYLTGREFLGLCAGLAGVPAAAARSRIGELLERVGISDHADVQLRRYSKGMLQRVGLAQALVNEPALVVLDEPLTGLDPLGRADFKEIIIDLKRRGAAVFFSSHVLPDAEAICDRVAIISRGRLLRTGAMRDLLQARTRSLELVCGNVPEQLYPALAALARSARR
ncbi:MAG TPA: ABC transporter ATP-binding protein, partial [Candidatus Edwardsbacteria bacterium]|nr:ABC transporter ATP-binding protein [Candidatus Edwardsbacteria bacterium]